MYLDINQLPDHIRTLCGRGPVRVELLKPGQTVHIGSMQWDGGTRDLYHVASLDSPIVKPVEDKRPWPQNMAPIGATPLPPRHVIINTGTFCGKPATPVLYALAADVSPMLEGPKHQLTDLQSQVLGAIAGLNSKGRADFRARHRISDAQWLAACQDLSGLGLVTLNKRGAAAITTAGRNAAPRVY